jgi:hypothetical protein
MQREIAHSTPVAGAHPIGISIEPALANRNRLTSAFRIILAIPHLVLVGGPSALALSLLFSPDSDRSMDWGGGGGVFGVVAMVCATIAWFAIVFTGRMPRELWKLNAYFLRWRIRAAAYVALLRDEYPPFGDGAYPVRITLPDFPVRRDRVSVGFRIILVIPHLIMVWVLGCAWLVSSVCAWFMVLITGNMPRALHDFGTGVLRWTTNVEGYLLLLHDEFPPFSLH